MVSGVVSNREGKIRLIFQYYKQIAMFVVVQVVRSKSYEYNEGYCQQCTVCQNDYPHSTISLHFSRM